MNGSDGRPHTKIPSLDEFDLNVGVMLVVVAAAVLVCVFGIAYCFR